MSQDGHSPRILWRAAVDEGDEDNETSCFWSSLIPPGSALPGLAAAERAYVEALDAGTSIDRLCDLEDLALSLGLPAMDSLLTSEHIDPHDPNFNNPEHRPAAWLLLDALHLLRRVERRPLDSIETRYVNWMLEILLARALPQMPEESRRFVDQRDSQTAAEIDDLYRMFEGADD